MSSLSSHQEYTKKNPAIYVGREFKEKAMKDALKKKMVLKQYIHYLIKKGGLKA